MARMLILDGMSVLKTTAGGMAFLDNGFAYNFFTQLGSYIKKFQDIKGIIVCWEGGHEFRAKIYPEYKSNRTGNAEIREQRALVQELLKYVGVDQVYTPGHEGDDTMAWLVNNLGVPAVLVSNDKDILQLVRPNISLLQKSPYSEGKKNLRVEITHDNFQFYTGWPTVGDFLNGKCVIGDGSDEIPGITGVGDATAKAFFLGQTIPPKMAEKIETFMESQEFSRNKMLMDLITPRHLEPVWNLSEPSKEKALTFLETVGGVGWPSVTKKFEDWWALYESARP